MGGGAGSGVGYGTGNARGISAGVLNGKAIILPKPAYPSVARAAGASGAVSVQITIDESGNVISATAVGGHPLLRAAAVAAARQAKFTPVKLSGRPVKTVGAIVYNFVTLETTPTSSSVAVGEKDVTLLLEEQKRIELEAKLHPALLALVDRLKEKSAKPGVDEVKFVRDGRAEIQIWLTDKSGAIIEQLKQLGFEVVLDPKTARMIIGRVPIEKLAALAELEFVRYVAPRLSGK